MVVWVNLLDETKALKEQSYWKGYLDTSNRFNKLHLVLLEKESIYPQRADLHNFLMGFTDHCSTLKVSVVRHNEQKKRM